MRRGPVLHEVLFEFQIQGKAVRVSAIDPATNTEVNIVGDPRHGEPMLKKIAMRKLMWVLRRKYGPEDKRESRGKGKKPPGKDSGKTDILA